MLGERARRTRSVASDMWAAFINVVRARCGSVVHVLDRFHVVALLSKAIDDTRREEVCRLRAEGRRPVLTKTRWRLLERGLSGQQRIRLRELLACNLRTVRAYLLEEQFQHFWSYTTAWGGRRFLASWTRQALRTRVEPIKKFARTLRAHEPALLDWFRARGRRRCHRGFNNKARITTRTAHGFRTYEHAEIAQYHSLGDLPESEWLTHRFT